MLKQLKKESGFTIIELLIVIAIIGILATLVLTNFRGAQAKSRDTVRTNEVNSLYQKLEEFYNENGGYPDGEFTLTAAQGINDAATDGAEEVFPGIDQAALTDDDGNAISYTFTDAATATEPALPDGDTAEYVYLAYGVGCTERTDFVSAGCSKYYLASFLEQDSNGYRKQSLN